MNTNELHVHQSFQGAFLWGWLKRFTLQFHFIHGLVTTWLGYDKDQNRPKTPITVPSPGPNQRELLSLESTERGIASMSTDDETLRNALVHMQKA
ncbi:hypothetical protein JT05_11685 [Desulfosporosinus sp. Tol-M]|jgi:hypothetical protein|nr:hypothetical protein JT05_11685 [Desulfosporosinus sp. Tol-M]